MSTDSQTNLHAKLTGKLQYNATLTLHTQKAQALFSGKSEKHGPVGVPQFASLIHKVSRAAQVDDPYADFILMKVEDGLITIRKQIQASKEKYQTVLNAQADVDIKIAFNENPARIHLNFASSYGDMAAHLCKDFDHFARVVLTAKKVGIPLDEPHDTLINTACRQIRRVLSIPCLWQQTGVTRQAIREESETAIKARECMKSMSLPDQILKGELRAYYAPKIMA